MEISQTLVVIIMFVTIVGIGIGNILMTFASIVSQFHAVTHRTSMLWLTLMLFSFLNMFWNVLELASRENWHFATFLYVIAGPIMLVFAANLLSRYLEDGGADTADQDVLEENVLTRFFWFFAGVQIWFMGMDYVLGAGWATTTNIGALLAVISVALALYKNQKVRAGFSIVLLSLVLADTAVQAWL